MAEPNRIQFYRKQLGLSQEELGERLYVSRQTVSQWETGQTVPTVDNLTRLRELFGVSVDELLGLEPVGEPPAEEAAEAYVFQYTEEDLRNLARIHTKPFRAREIVCAILTVIGLIWMSSVTVMAWFFGFALAFLIVNIRQHRAYQKRQAELRPTLLSNTYMYTLTPDGIRVTSVNDESGGTSQRILRELRKVHKHGSYILLEMPEGNYYTLRDTDLPEGSPLRAYIESVRSAASKASTAPLTTKPSLRSQIISGGLFAASLLAAVGGMAFVGAVISVVGAEADQFLRYMWVMYLLLPIPLASIVWGCVRKRRGYRWRLNLISGIIVALWLGIFGTFSLLAGQNENPMLIVETELGIDIPGYDPEAKEYSLLFPSSIDFTDTDAATFEAALASHDAWLTSLPAELEEADPNWTTEPEYTHLLLYDRDSGTYNTVPAPGARMVALYYNADYNTLRIHLYTAD